MSRKDTIAETPVRLFAVAILLVGVWILTYWLYEPREPPVTLASDEAPAGVLFPPDGPLDDPTMMTDEFSRPSLSPGSDPAPIARDPIAGRYADSPEFREYIVQPNDTIQKIARREYGSVSYASVILNANPFVDPNRLKAGRTRLRLPVDPENVFGRDVTVQEPGSDVGSGAEPDPADEPAFVEHLVSKRDTLWGIAKLYYGKGHLWPRIHEANRDLISNPDRPPVGRTIRIPMNEGA